MSARQRGSRGAAVVDSGGEDMWLVECPRCGRPKAPRGCVPVNDAEVEDYCTRACPDYEKWPFPSAPPASVRSV